MDPENLVMTDEQTDRQTDGRRDRQTFLRLYYQKVFGPVKGIMIQLNNRTGKTQTNETNIPPPIALNMIWIES